MHIFIYKIYTHVCGMFGGSLKKEGERQRERQKKGVCLFARVNKGNSTMIHVENIYGLHDTPWTLKFPDELLLQLHHKRHHLSISKYFNYMKHEHQLPIFLQVSPTKIDTPCHVQKHINMSRCLLRDSWTESTGVSGPNTASGHVLKIDTKIIYTPEN